MIVTISGPPGSGKTTVGRLVAKALGCGFRSTGEAFRAIAAERNISLAELGRQAENDHTIDLELDRRVVSSLTDPLVLEGRLSGYMCVRYKVKAFKVWVSAPVEVRASRIAEREGKDPRKVVREMLVREESERKRYREIYKIDFNDVSIYDMVVDSRTDSAQKIAEAVVAGVRHA
jgi:cytidylate kinase